MGPKNPAESVARSQRAGLDGACGATAPETIETETIPVGRRCFARHQPCFVARGSVVMDSQDYWNGALERRRRLKLSVEAQAAIA